MGGGVIVGVGCRLLLSKLVHTYVRRTIERKLILLLLMMSNNDVGLSLCWGVTGCRCCSSLRGKTISGI